MVFQILIYLPVLFYQTSFQNAILHDFITRMGQNLGLFITSDFATYFSPLKAKEKT